MEEVTSSVLSFHNADHSRNTTLTSDESNGTNDSKYNTWNMAYLVGYAIIIIFGFIGNLLTFMVM